MKRSLILGFLIFPLLASAQAKYQVWVAGKKAGTATLTQKLMPDGTKSVNLSMDLKSDTLTATLRSESSYTSKGVPIRKFQETLVPSQKIRRTIVVTFNDEGANAVVDLNGKRTTKRVPLPNTANKADLSEFWFLRDKPKVGAEVKAYTFDLESLSWEMIVTTYVGVVDATIGGKKVKANKTESEKGKAFIDDAGVPLRLELESAALERIG